jgi:hypothetical protein
MKKIVCLSIMGLMIAAFGCNKIKNLANISVNIPYSTQVSMPSVNGYSSGIALPYPGLSVDFPSTAIPTDAQHYFDEYHTSSSNIVYVNLNSLNMQILMPAGQYFDFLDSAQLYLSTKTLPEVLVAYDYNIAKGQTTINFTTAGDLNLKGYFVADTMYFRLHAHINATPAAGTQFKIATDFHMTANPLD